ncbi:hypothetical protein RRG08_029190 [Elysia crispata]|uniref:Uncharacterized protein n=1 Tax=Elysia crispata TaxID=231223 RepID=A0AAE1AJR0_9GAST|nr:hypothetical protein RRG08_029190 [Elysia crispata]
MTSFRPQSRHSVSSALTSDLTIYENPLITRLVNPRLGLRSSEYRPKLPRPPSSQRRPQPLLYHLTSGIQVDLFPHYVLFMHKSF